MKVLAIIVQTKRGENAFVVTSNTFTQEMAQEYSHAIYNIIVKTFSIKQEYMTNLTFQRKISAC